MKLLARKKTGKCAATYYNREKLGSLAGVGVNYELSTPYLGVR